MALKVAIQTLKSYLKLTFEHEFHNIPNSEDSAAKDDSHNYIKVKSPIVCHLLRNRLLLQTLTAQLSFNLLLNKL